MLLACTLCSSILPKTGFSTNRNVRSSDLQLRLASHSSRGSYDSLSLMTSKPTCLSVTPAEMEPFCLVVVHEQGIAMIPEKEFESRVRITIKAWTAKNETLQIIRNPAAVEHVDFPVSYP